MTVSIVLAYYLAFAGIKLMAAIAPNERKSFAPLYVLAMLPLIYANEIAIRLVPLLNHAADFFQVLGNQIGHQLPEIAFRLDMQSIQIVQVVFVLIGFSISIAVNDLQLKSVSIGKHHLKFLRSFPMAAMAALSIVFYVG